MKNRVLEFIDSWLALLDRDRVRVFDKLLGSNRIALRRVVRTPAPAPAPPPVAVWSVVYPAEGGPTIQQVIGEPLIIGGWED